MLSEGEVTYLLLKDLQNSMINNDFMRDINPDPISDKDEDSDGDGAAPKESDVGEWNARILGSLPPERRTWQDSPWIIAEFYFYRRVIEAFSYFYNKDGNFDMFEKQKQNGLLESLDLIRLYCTRLFELSASVDRRQIIQFAINHSLWGNRMDLSLWPAGSSRERVSDASDSDSLLTNPFVLDNNIAETADFLISASDAGASESGTVDVIVDNAGYELFTDLYLGYILLQQRIAKRIVFHVKGHPTFVSDVTSHDIDFTIKTFMESKEESISKFGNECSEFIKNGQFVVAPDNYWCQPHPFWDMPTRVQDRLMGSTIVIVKGDANYRRMVGDRSWPFDTPVDSCFQYWQVPVCPLRILKSEVAAGLTEEAQSRAASADPKYLVSGKWGVCQLYIPSK
jgi:uncharacterized protein with ATP-grasp and redox domains